MDGIKKNTVSKTGHHYSKNTHRTLQKSSTLNRKFVKKPTKVAAKPVISSAAMRAAATMRRRQLIASSSTRAKVQTPAKAQAQKVEATAAAAKKQDAENDKISVKFVKKDQAKQAQQAPVQAKAQAAQDDNKIQVKVESKKAKADTKPTAPAVKHPTVKLANARIAARKADEPRHLSAQELKNQAIQQALRKVATMNEDQTTAVEEKMTGAITKKKPFWQKRKLAIALAMSAVSIALLGYLVHLNLPDLSVRVAAMQTGIDGAYPNYIPKNYRLDGLVSEKDGKIVMSFTGKDNTVFTLSEEKSNWDSSAVLANFVTPKWGTDYSIVKGQGLTIYTYNSNAIWVNGGILYYIEDTNDILTKQQLHDIAVSL
ncbi:MAG: hypothetical protein ACK5MU_03045 [Candidatus Saccharimonadales bacterium]